MQCTDRIHQPEMVQRLAVGGMRVRNFDAGVKFVGFKTCAVPDQARHGLAVDANFDFRLKVQLERNRHAETGCGYIQYANSSDASLRSQQSRIIDPVARLTSSVAPLSSVTRIVAGRRSPPLACPGFYIPIAARGRLLLRSGRNGVKCCGEAERGAATRFTIRLNAASHEFH